MSSNTNIEELRLQVLDHFNNAMPVQVDRDYAKYLLDNFVQQKIIEARIDERNIAKQKLDSLHNIYKKELDYSNRYQLAVIERESNKIEPIVFCAKCSNQLKHNKKGSNE